MDCKSTLLGILCVMFSTSCQTPSQKTSLTATSQGAPTAIAQDQPTNVIKVGNPLPLAQQALSIALSEATVRSPALPLQPDLWREMRAHMRLDLHLHQKRVQQEIRWLQRNPQYFHRLQARLQTYLPYIYTQTQLREMPAELALLPIVESALDTFAFSHGGAAGPWQFVRGTAKQYGLQINDWYDGRRDIVASTGAALDYLTYLNKRFDNWYLALAGYNAGQGNVSRALRRNPNGTFFELRLPKETQAYVPRLLALSAVIKDPSAFGLTLPKVEPLTTFHVVDTHSQFQLTKLSKLLNLEMQDIYRWNPSLNQWATPPKGPHRLIIPAQIELAVAQKAIDELPAKQRVDWTEIRVRSGDTLSQIARRHGTDVTSLKLANQINGSSIRAGHKLLIPKHAAALATTPRHAKGALDYVVQPGDSLWTIARSHSVSLTKLMKNNHLGPKDTLSIGKTLKIPGAGSNQRKVTRKVRYKVRRGDSLARIAGKFNVSINDIARWNGLDTKRYLQPGQGLLLHVNVIGG